MHNPKTSSHTKHEKADLRITRCKIRVYLLTQLQPR